MLNTGFPPWPAFTQEEADAVSSVLLSNKVNYWTGNESREFEREFASATDCKYAIGLGNGTLALDLALQAIGLADGDEVVVTPRTFIASISCVVTAGCTPVFADIDANSQNITAESIERVITSRTRAIIVVHLAGMPAEMDDIMRLADQHNLIVIEDCAQAHGARYKGRSVGSIGHIGAWSFCQDKIMTTGGEGGMVTTNDQNLWSTMWSYKDHGKSWDSVYETDHPPGFRWLHDSFGTNWRMTELQGVIGRIQTARLPKWSETRRTNANAIWNACSQIPWLKVPIIPDHIQHAAYKAYVFIDHQQLPSEWSRDKVIEFLVAKGLPAFSGSCSEVYLEKAFDSTNFRPKQRLPVAQKLAETSIMFLVHPGLEGSYIDQVVSALAELGDLVAKDIA